MLLKSMPGRLRNPPGVQTSTVGSSSFAICFSYVFWNPIKPPVEKLLQAAVACLQNNTKEDVLG